MFTLFVSALAAAAGLAATDPPPPAAAPVPVPASASVPAGEAVLARDLSDLAALLDGRWDNDLQVFFEPELGVQDARRNPRFHAHVRAIPGAPGAPVRFYVEHRSGGEHGPVARQRVWTLAVDRALDAVRMSVLAPTDAKALEGAWSDPARLAAISSGSLAPVAGCDVIWKRRAGGFSGETRPGACKVQTVDGNRTVTVSERHDISDNIWDVRDIGVDDTGMRVFGAADGAPARFRKARAFVCWAGAPRGADTVFARDLVVHDQGGAAVARLPGATPGEVTVRLRNIVWPVGDNRPSLTLYVTGGSGERADSFAWTEPDGTRIALNARGLQASCTLDVARQWQ